MAPLVVTFVTGNQNKLKEVRSIIGDEHAAKFVLEAKAVDLPELQGEPEDIAKEKVMLAAKDIGGKVSSSRPTQHKPRSTRRPLTSSLSSTNTLSHRTVHRASHHLMKAM